MNFESKLFKILPRLGTARSRKRWASLAFLLLVGNRSVWANGTFNYWQGAGYFTVSNTSWNAGSINWTAGSPFDDWITLEDSHVTGHSNTALSYAQTTDANFSSRYLDLGGAYNYVLAGASGTGTSHTLTLTGAGIGTLDVLILRSTAIVNSPANSLYGQTFYLGFHNGISAFSSGALANINLSYSGLKKVTVNQSASTGSSRRTLAITSNVIGTGGVDKEGDGTLVLELADPTTVGNTFTGNFQLGSGTVLTARDTDLFNGTTSLRHGAFGMGTITINGGTIGAADSTSRLIQNSLNIGGNFSTAAGGGLEFSGTIDLGGAILPSSVVRLAGPLA